MDTVESQAPLPVTEQQPPAPPKENLLSHKWLWIGLVLLALVSLFSGVYFITTAAKKAPVTQTSNIPISQHRKSQQSDPLTFIPSPIIASLFREEKF